MFVRPDVGNPLLIRGYLLEISIAYYPSTLIRIFKKVHCSCAPAFCTGVGPAAPAGASGAEGGATADPGGLLPDTVARDIQALILQTEEVAATGRTCQTFVRANGLVPVQEGRFDLHHAGQER